MTNLGKAFEDIVQFRRSVRLYDPNAEYDSNVVSSCLNLATLAPNSSNLQLWEFYHIQTPELKNEIASYCLSQPAATTANELVVFVTRKDKFKEHAKWNVDQVEAAYKKRGLPSEEVPSTKNPQDVLTNISQDDQTRLKSVKQYYTKLLPQIYTNDPVGILGVLRSMYVNWIEGPRKPTYRQVRKKDVDIICHKSLALAAQTFMLAMASEGYDTCPMEGIDTSRIKKALHLPQPAQVSMVISCGKRKEEGIYGKRVRIDNADIIFER